MINVLLQKIKSILGYEIDVGNYYNKLKVWKQWYKGNVLDFHRQTEQGKPVKVYSMGMAKKIGEDYSALVVNEQTRIDCADKKVLEFLAGDEENNGGVLRDINFWKELNDYCERMFGYAGSIGAIVGLKDATLNIKTGDITGGNYAVRFCTSEHIIPLSWDGQNVTEAAFYSLRTIKGNTYLILEIHTINKESAELSYNVDTKVFLLKGENLLDTGSSIVEMMNIPEHITFPFKPFSICTSNIANNIVEGFPMGVPAIANAIDEMKSVDIYFNNFCQDGALGKKRMFIGEDYVETEQVQGSNGKTYTRPVNPEFSNSPFYILKRDNILNGQQGLFQEFNPVLRVAENKDAIQQALNVLSLKVGLGNQYYVFNQAGYATATQVRVSNLALSYSVNKQRTPYWRFIQDICTALINLANTQGAGLKADAEIVVKWDDSLLNDPQQEKTLDLQLVSQGIMPAWEFRVKWMDETEEVAKKIIADEKASNPTINDLFLPPQPTTGNNEDE